MDGKEDEGPDQEQGHEEERVVKNGVLVAVRVVRVDDVLGKILVGFRMALLTGLDATLLADRGLGALCLVDIVMAVAVIARRDAFPSKGDGLAVEGLTVALEHVLMTLPTDLVALQFEGGVRRLRDLM